MKRIKMKNHTQGKRKESEMMIQSMKVIHTFNWYMKCYFKKHSEFREVKSNNNNSKSTSLHTN